MDLVRQNFAGLHDDDVFGAEQVELATGITETLGERVLVMATRLKVRQGRHSRRLLRGRISMPRR
jgi:hypothetical protein